MTEKLTLIFGKQGRIFLKRRVLYFETLCKYRGRYSLDGILLKNESRGNFYCHEKSCPFAVQIVSTSRDGVEQPTVDKVLFPVHCHAFPQSSRLEIKDLVQRELESSTKTVLGVRF